MVTRGLKAAQGGARAPPPRRSGASACRDGSVGVGAKAGDSNAQSLRRRDVHGSGPGEKMQAAYVCNARHTIRKESLDTPNHARAEVHRRDLWAPPPTAGSWQGCRLTSYT